MKWFVFLLVLSFVMVLPLVTSDDGIEIVSDTLLQLTSVNGSSYNESYDEYNYNQTTSPAGNNGEIQFNDNGVFGADDELFWDNANKRVGIGTSTPQNQLSLVSGTGHKQPDVSIYGSIFATTKTTDYANSLIGMWMGMERANAANTVNKMTSGLNSWAYHSGTGDMTGALPYHGLMGGRYGYRINSNSATIDYAAGLSVMNSGINGKTSTVTNSRGLQIEPAELQEITAINHAGVYLYDVNPGGGSVTNNYGIYIEDISEGTSRNYAIYSDGGASYHRGDLTVKSNISADNFFGNRLDVTTINVTDDLYVMDTSKFYGHSNVTRNQYIGSDLEVLGNSTLMNNAFITGADTSLNKTALYGYGNIRLGSHYNNRYGSICFETNLVGYGGDDTVWCIDNGGNGLRFYDPITSDVSLRATPAGWQVGDASHIKNISVSGLINAGGNLTAQGEGVFFPNLQGCDDGDVVKIHMPSGELYCD